MTPKKVSKAAPVQPTAEQVRTARQALGVSKKPKEQQSVDDNTWRESETKYQTKQRYHHLESQLNRPNTLKKFGLTRKDISNLLKQPALAEGLEPHQVKMLRDVGYQNISLADLAKRQGVSITGLEIILDSLAARVVGNARSRGIPIRHEPDALDADADFDKTQAIEAADVDNDLLGVKTQDPYPEY